MKMHKLIRQRRCQQEECRVDWTTHKSARRQRFSMNGSRPSILPLLSFFALILANLPIVGAATRSAPSSFAFQYKPCGNHLHSSNTENQRDIRPLFLDSHPRSDRRIPLHATSSLSSNFAPKDPTSNLQTAGVPRHVAFICDGNSRWAKARGLPASAGHVAGADQLVKILDSVKESGVLYCTLFAFSTENWKRSPKEIKDLMRIMEESCHRFYNRALSERVQVQILGDMEDERISNGLREALHKLERDTAEHVARESGPPFTVCFAINYGGKKDILNASLKLAQAIADNNLSPEQVDEDTLASFLSTKNVPDPDLIIRTSGECRLSNFMLWNAAYAELYFTDVLWPDFNHQSWLESLQWYSQRQRKFGGRQLSSSPSMTNGVAATRGIGNWTNSIRQLDDPCGWNHVTHTIAVPCRRRLTMII